jgi:hypothetical protein
MATRHFYPANRAQGELIFFEGKALLKLKAS